MAACPRCGGTGFEIVEKEGREFAQPCACRASARPRPDFVGGARIPPRYQPCSLENFADWTPSHGAALERAINYCSGYPHLGADEGKGLLLTGGNGVGKTHLAVAVLRELVTNKGARGQFWDFHELIRMIRSSYDEATRTTELQVLEPVVEADILLLDDLGAWRMTDWMLDTLFFIINQRYLGRRATIITTNFPDVSPKEAAARSNANRRLEYLVDRVGNSVRSRLMEMCVVIRLEGDDQRAMQQGPRRPASPAPPVKPPTPRFGG
jgi:DNA replication protein DnaC